MKIFVGCVISDQYIDSECLYYSTNTIGMYYILSGISYL